MSRCNRIRGKADGASGPLFCRPVGGLRLLAGLLLENHRPGDCGLLGFACLVPDVSRVGFAKVNFGTISINICGRRKTTCIAFKTALLSSLEFSEPWDHKCLSTLPSSGMVSRRLSSSADDPCHPAYINLFDKQSTFFRHIFHLYDRLLRGLWGFKRKRHFPFCNLTAA